MFLYSESMRICMKNNFVYTDEEKRLLALSRDQFDAFVKISIVDHISPSRMMQNRCKFDDKIVNDICDRYYDDLHNNPRKLRQMQLQNEKDVRCMIVADYYKNR